MARKAEPLPTAETVNERFSGDAEMLVQLDRVASVQAKLHEIVITEGTEEDARRKTVLALIDRLLLAVSTGDPVLYGAQFVSALSGLLDTIDQNVTTYGCGQSADPVPSLVEFVRHAFVPDAATAAAQLGGVAAAAAASVSAATATTKEAEAELAAIIADRETAQVALESLQSDTRAQLDAAVSDYTEQLAHSLANARREVETDRAAFVKVCESHDLRGEELIEKLAQQLSLSADYRLSAEYEHQAKSEEEQADRMRTYAFWWGAGAAVAAALSLVLTYLGAAREWDLNQLALLPSKVTVVAAFAALASYSGSQSSRHRNAARQLRTTQLELTNLGAYLEELSDDRRAAVRETLVPSFFGKTVVAHPDDGPSTASVLGGPLQRSTQQVAE